MAIIFLFCLFALSATPSPGSGEVLHLKDGSVFKGVLIGVTEKAVVFETSFGSQLEIPRDNVAMILFDEEYLVPRMSESIEKAPELPGSLYVDFGGTKLTSKISVHRNKDLEGCLRANSISQVLYVDGEVAFSNIDSIPDKEISKGPEKIFKNVITLKNIRVQVPSGPHQIRLVVKSIDGAEYENRFDGGPLIKILESHNMLFYAEPTSQIDVRLRKKRWGLSGTEFFIRDGGN